jgi:hypothetical protein
LGYTVLYKAIDKNKSLESQLCEADFWEPLKDKAVFNFRYILLAVTITQLQWTKSLN